MVKIGCGLANRVQFRSRRRFSLAAEFCESESPEETTMPIKILTCVIGLIVISSPPARSNPRQAPEVGFARQSITPEDIDAATFSQWNQGEEKPLKVQDG